VWLTNGGWSSSLISKIWLIACRSGIYNKLEAILFEEMRRLIDLLWGNREIYGKFALNI
jgi:hypothetical protein